ncbi:ENACB [Mytilus edulis]|uniref:SCNN1B n=1 Tax=Mytilus edulis TaxID=6550 RepID=A0A8S3TD92_MYTED|nr:ENACB [Mytilus edulis]
MEKQYSEWDGYGMENYLGNELFSEHQIIITEIEKRFDDSTASHGKRKKRDIRAAVEDNQVPNVAIQRTFYTVHLKGTITLECDVTGNPPAFSINWQREVGDTSMDLTSDSENKYNGSTPDNPSLTIFNAEQSDRGVYRCTAENEYGIAESPRIYLKLVVVDLDVDPILRASGAFRLLMSSFGSEGNFENETEQAIKALSADYSDFVIYCNFEGRQCNESVFVPFFDKYYGMCYRFPPEPMITKRAGPLFALQLIINVNQSDYVPFIASEAGIRLSIHEHGSHPYLENNGISVATGFRTDISLIQFESFLSNIGGSLGLWIGMSAISIGELLELCFFLLRSMKRHKKVTETQTDVIINDTVETTIIDL